MGGGSLQGVAGTVNALLKEDLAKAYVFPGVVPPRSMRTPVQIQDGVVLLSGPAATSSSDPDRSIEKGSVKSATASRFQDGCLKPTAANGCRLARAGNVHSSIVV